MTIEKVPLKKVVQQTLASFFYPEVVLLLFLPIVISLILVGTFLFVTSGFWVGLFTQSLILIDPAWQKFLAILPQFLSEFLLMLAPLVPFLFVIAMFAIAFPIVIVLNLLITSVATSGYLVGLIARRDFKGLQKLGKPRFAQSILNSVGAIVIYLLAWIITLPLWLIPGVQLILPIVLTAWLNRQICTFDALTDFSTDTEFETLTNQTKETGFVLGALTAGLNYIPFALFISPVITMVAYIYLQLGSLQKLRQ